MSYDIHLKINTGKEFYMIEDVGNYTSNVSGMWEKAIGIELSQLDGMKASDCIPLLQPALKHMEQNSKEYENMSPENGWGTFSGAFQYLKLLLELCEKHPETFVSISY